MTYDLCFSFVWIVLYKTLVRTFKFLSMYQDCFGSNFGFCEKSRHKWGHTSLWGRGIEEFASFLQRLNVEKISVFRNFSLQLMIRYFPQLHIETENTSIYVSKRFFMAQCSDSDVNVSYFHIDWIVQEVLKLIDVSVCASEYFSIQVDMEMMWFTAIFNIYVDSLDILNKRKLLYEPLHRASNWGN